MSTGGFASGPFRTGASQGTVVSAILNSINESRGTAYATEPGTAVWVENYALAKTLADAWESARRFSNQFDPQRLTSYLDRWEGILGIVPSATATDNARRRAIAAKWSLFNVVPTSQAATDFLKILLPAIYVATLHTASSVARGSVTGGVTIPGGVTLLDGPFKSSIANLVIRMVEPPSMSDSEFYQTVNSFKPFFDDFLPAHVTYDWGRYGLNLGKITVAAGDTAVYGTGTLFITGSAGAVVAGSDIEVYDDLGNVRTLIATSVINETTLAIQTPPPIAITLQPFKRFGFFLDATNLDNCFLT
jgi:hypothetical protein